MSATLVGVVRGLFAIGKCSTDDDVTSFDINRGFVGVTRIGAGEYLLEMQDGVNLSDSATALVQCYGTAAVFTSGLEAVVSQNIGGDLTDLTVWITTAAGVPIDADFAIQVQDVNPV